MLTTATSTIQNSDPDYFYYMHYSKPAWTIDPPVEGPPYRIPKFAKISGTCMIHCCIGKKGYGILGDPCSATLPHGIRLATNAVLKQFTESGSAWSGCELVKLAKLCLCQDCGQTQLSDVVIAWVHELETQDEPELGRVDSVVDDQEKKSMVADLVPVKTLVAASIATRDVLSKVYGFWFWREDERPEERT